MAYVYVYYDPRKSPPEPIHVGKGQGKRVWHHLGPGCKNPLLQRKLAHIREAGLKPIIVKTVDGISHEEAMAIERQLIDAFGRITMDTGTLCNFTEGGDGTPGYKHREDTLRLFSEQRAGKPQTVAQYEANCNRQPATEESRRRRSIANRGHRRHTPEQMAILRSQQYSAHRFMVTLPSGAQIEVINLRRFCKEHGLDRTSATKAATKGVAYKGHRFVRLGPADHSHRS